MEKMEKLIAMFLLLTLVVIPISVTAVELDSTTRARTNINIEVDSRAEARSSEEKTIYIGGENIKTSLGVEQGTQNRVLLSNGLYAEIRIMPSVAAETAITRVRLNACSEQNDCTVELKEARVNGEARASYEVRAKKQYRVFGIFRANANTETNVNAETGAVIDTDTSWWTTFSTEVRGNVASQARAN